MAPPDDAVVLIDGPWTHRELSANGARFHVVEAGAGPLVLLLHGFPEFWWSWREQIPVLADAGFRVVAADLRGYGASDKPPRGYDAFTLAADVAGMVRALGERDAVIVGHDWGGFLAWAVAALHPEVVRRVAVLSMPHVLRLRAALARNADGQLRSSWYVFGAQLPRLAERSLLRDDAAMVGRLLHTWGAPGWLDADTERTYRTAIQVPGVAHSALEYYRWAVRSQLRPSGHQFVRRMAQPVTAPLLQLHGSLDGCLSPATALGSGRYVAGEYHWRLLDGVGHFLQQEAPDTVSGELVEWAKA